MELLEILRRRRSVREYTGEPVAEEHIEKILQAGLLAPSSKGRRPWELILVRDKKTLQALTECRGCGAKMLAGADCAVVVVADETSTDVWVEDCSIVMAHMHLMASSLGVGSCWIQGRLRKRKDGRLADDYVRELLQIPEQYRLSAVLSLGMPKEEPQPRALEELPVDKIHREMF